LTNTAPPPLILSLALDDRAFALLDGLRQAHFPPERNVLSAHLTLFHHLPGEREADVVAELDAACAEQPPLRLVSTDALFLGRGVAIGFEAPELLCLRERLAARWRPWLGAQDRQRFRPHVTVQNKVPPERARALAADLSATLPPLEATGEGLLLWRYLGGPWERVGSYPFRVPDSRLAAR